MHRTLLACSLFVLAAPGIAANNESAPGIDIIVERQHQDFGEISTNLDTVALQPHLFVSNWDFNFYLSWQYADGEYFVNGFQPQATHLCKRFDNLSAARIRLLQRRGGVDPERLGAICGGEGTAASTQDSSESGLGDISAAAHYNIALDTAGLWLLSLGAAYKWDNGDADAGIGSGTREPSVDASLGFENSHWRVTIAGGYAFVDASDSDEDLDNYAFASLDSAWKALSWLAIGATCDFKQSYVPHTDEIRSAALYVEFIPAAYLRLAVEGRDYLDTEGFPQREYSGRVIFSF